MDFDEFEGAPNVMHVSTEGDDANDGLTWATAKATVAGALAPNGTRSNVLVLVAPGAYSGFFDIRGSNVSIVGSGWGTRIESDELLGVARINGNNVSIQDIQLVNAKEDVSVFQYSGIFHSDPTIIPNVVSVRRCAAHGAGAANLILIESVSVTDSILDGFENGATLGRYVPQGPPGTAFNAIASNVLFRCLRNLDVDVASIHIHQGSLTGMNCSFNAIAAASTLTREYRGAFIEVDYSECVLFGCTAGSNHVIGVTFNGASFTGIEGSSTGRLKTTGCAVRAIGSPPSKVASFKASTTDVIIDADWTLRIPL